MYNLLTRFGGPLALCLSMFPAPAPACSAALAFAVDVSGSIVEYQYRKKMRGLADALRDPIVADGLVSGQVSLLLVQWTGSGFQKRSIPWTPIRSDADAAAFALAVETAPRAYPGTNTALGDALAFTRDAFADAPVCDRQIIDVSGNGRSNEGIEPLSQRALFAAAAMTVNALVIEHPYEDLEGYFTDQVIAGPDAFVVSVADMSHFTDGMRRKLMRELAIQMVSLQP